MAGGRGGVWANPAEGVVLSSLQFFCSATRQKAEDYEGREAHTLTHTHTPLRNLRKEGMEMKIFIPTRYGTMDRDLLVNDEDDLVGHNQHKKKERREGRRRKRGREKGIAGCTAYSK